MAMRTCKWLASLLLLAAGSALPGYATCYATDSGFVAFYDDDLFDCDDDDDGFFEDLFDDVDDWLDDIFDED